MYNVFQNLWKFTQSLHQFDSFKEEIITFCFRVRTRYFVTECSYFEIGNIISNFKSLIMEIFISSSLVFYCIRNQDLNNMLTVLNPSSTILLPK